MTKVYIATKDDVTAALAAFAASLGASNTSADDGTPVGRMVLDSVLRPGYVKANGATLANATVDYPRLVAFVRANPELFTDDVEVQMTKPELYVYSLADDTLTLPNYMNRVLQCSETVTSVDAGLPNITGVNNIYYVGQHEPGLCTYDKSTDTYIRGTGAIRCYSGNASYLRNRGMSTNADSTRVLFGYSDFDASRSNAIYGASTTVQPSAITLIPQIRY